ncbi:MAG: hypothetical protein AMJ56_07625 [Anaerolineae bacterium SG8_19]|nr:MAG: hypothetical protein AMJ56_07625 [Anaerolineae bacterium SG8_19]
MIDVFVIGIFAIIIGLILVAIGASFVSQGMDSLRYNENWGKYRSFSYYNNPLCKMNSKYFYFRPKGWVILSKKQWEDIEKSIGANIQKAKDNGKILGKALMLKQIQDQVSAEKERVFPSSPYKILGMDSTASLTEIQQKYNALMAMYDPKNFVDLDRAFIELAEVRQDQIRKAWNKIQAGIGEKPIKDFSGGNF